MFCVSQKHNLAFYCSQSSQLGTHSTSRPGEVQDGNRNHCCCLFTRLVSAIHNQTKLHHSLSLYVSTDVWMGWGLGHKASSSRGSVFFIVTNIRCRQLVPKHVYTSAVLFYIVHYVRYQGNMNDESLTLFINFVF